MGEFKFKLSDQKKTQKILKQKHHACEGVSNVLPWGKNILQSEGTASTKVLCLKLPKVFKKKNMKANVDVVNEGAKSRR